MDMEICITEFRSEAASFFNLQIWLHISMPRLDVAHHEPLF